MVTIPVVGVALFQFGLGTEFWSCFAVYLIIQGLDGNLLVPVLFSEAVNLHPLVIILSVVIFGGLWGGDWKTATCHLNNQTLSYS